MFKKKIWSWARDSVLGLGVGLLTAGFVGLVTPDTLPIELALYFVVGNLLLLTALVLSLLQD